LNAVLEWFLHLDTVLPLALQQYGNGLYVVLFLVIFCETGLIIFPFLPGDSLLFAAGALSAAANLHIMLLWVLLVIAAILGDAVNYSIGYFLGEKLSKTRFLNPAHVEKTQAYFNKYGGKAIVLGRFLPIIRTFVPFVAGLSKMKYAKFSLFNIIGAFVWVTTLLFAGYFFANMPFVRKEFSSVILLIMVISVVPLFYDLIKAWFKKS
jgi:membrane-associated protein